MVGTTPKTFFRLGYGFSRSRNGTVNMHAASCIAAVTGAWLNEGGGAFLNNGAICHWDKRMIDAADLRDPSVRMLDQSRIGPVLTGDRFDLGDGPPVTAMLIQNTNPAVVAPDQNEVRAGLSREDLFLCVHEQFMTETAAMADLVLPATMFLEHDDIYQSGGHQHIMLGPKIVEPAGECRSNHEVISALAGRLGAEHEGFSMSARDIIDWTLRQSGWGTLEELEEKRWIDCQPPFEEAHYVNGFGYPDRKFRFKPDWPNVPTRNAGPMGRWAEMPALPDHWAVIDAADAAHPFRLATSPSRSFLNSSFTETPSSRAREGRPEVMIHPDDAAANGIGEGRKVRLGNTRGEVLLHARLFDGVRRGVLIAEGVWPNSAHEGAAGINTLTGADQTAPFGGAAYHDNKVWIRAAR
jgi:anaerobic selenocysteine-containing dehydrogenase